MKWSEFQSGDCQLSHCLDFGYVVSTYNYFFLHERLKALNGRSTVRIIDIKRILHIKRNPK